jgi:cobalt-zinc-cadmium efflux system outer membrane protein
VKGDGSRAKTEYDGEYGLTQTIEFPGKRALRRALAERNVDARELALAGFRNQLRIQVTNLFYRLLASGELVSLKEKRLVSARTFVAAARKKVDAGFAPEFETTKAEVEVLAAEKAVLQAQAERMAARAALNTLLGRKPGDAVPVAGTIDAGIAVPDQSVLLAEAEARNPVLKVQAAEVDRARLALALARRSRLPEFTVGPSFETEPDTRFYAFGISLPLPLWDQKKGEIATAEAEHRRASAELAKLQQEVARDVVTSAQQLGAAREGLSHYTPELRAKLANALDAAASTYAEGRTTLLVFLETQRTYFDTQTDYYETLEALSDARAALESALGVPLSEIQTPARGPGGNP